MRGKRLCVDKRGDLGRKIDTVDEDISILDNLLERATCKAN